MGNPALFYAPLNGSLAYQDRAGGGTLTGSGAVRYAPAEGARTNLVKNPSFETGTSNWTVSAGLTLTRPLDGHSGSYAVNITGDTTTNNLFQGANSPSRMDVVPGQQYTLSCYVKSPNGNRVQPAIVWTYADGTGATVSVSTLQTVEASFGRISYTVTVPAGYTRATPRFYLESSASGDWTFDAIQFELGATATDYFDGSTGGVWLDPLTGILGSANASPSVSQAVAWVEEGTTNSIPNPIFSNDTSNWATYSGSNPTLTRDTTYAFFGSAALKMVYDGTASSGIRHASTAHAAAGSGVISTGTFVIRGSGSYIIQVQELSAALAVLATSTDGTTFVADDSWRTCTRTYTTTNASCAYVRYNLMQIVAEVATAWVGFAQVEAKAYATSPCYGSIGTGYAWSGTAHASSSTRTVTRLTVDETNRVNAVRGTVAAKVLRDYTSNHNQYAFSVGTSSAGKDAIWLAVNRTSKLACAATVSAATVTATGTTPSNDTWYTLIGTWDGTAIAVYDDGTSGTATRATPNNDLNTSSDINIGSPYYSTEPMDGYIGPVLIADRPLTASERARLNGRTLWSWGILRRSGRHLKVM